jgi:methionine-gamma-lyase
MAMDDRSLLRRLGVQTTAVHAGEAPDPYTHASAPNVVMSTTFVIDPSVAFSANEINDETPYAYSRWGNPTVAQLERKLADLEGTESCLAFATGMAAIWTLFSGLLKSGDHLVMGDVTYAAASELANDTLPGLGIEVSRVDTSDLEAVRNALRPNTRLLYLETPSNPLLRLTDLPAAVAIGHEAGVPVAVDSTFATPIGLRPVEHGADFVVHSLTKYICGHGDALGGALLGRSDDIDRLRSTAIHMGGVISPFNAWLIIRGAATLPLRMRAHEQGALAVAERLQAHPKVKRVMYPGLPSHPQYELARTQMDNFSGMLTFQVEDGVGAAQLFSERLQIIHYAVSLGHHRSLMCYLPTADLLRTSFHLTETQEQSYRSFAGDGIFRLSVGLEDAADLFADLQQVLDLL